MPTLNRSHRASRQISPADLTPEDIVVAFVIERFRQLPRESFGDIVSLIKTLTSPDTPIEDQHEIFETIREILFPELVGEVHIGRAGSIEETQDKLHKRADHIGKTIKRKREEKNLTQAELGQRAGLPQSHICRLEAGMHSPSLRTLEKIASALSVTIGDLDPSN